MFAPVRGYLDASFAADHRTIVVSEPNGAARIRSRGRRALSTAANRPSAQPSHPRRHCAPGFPNRSERRRWCSMHRQRKRRTGSRRSSPACPAERSACSHLPWSELPPFDAAPSASGPVSASPKLSGRETTGGRPYRPPSRLHPSPAEATEPRVFSCLQRAQPGRLRQAFSSHPPEQARTLRAESEYEPEPRVMARRSFVYVTTSAYGTRTMMTVSPASLESVPTMRPRLVEMSPITAPAYSSPTVHVEVGHGARAV